MPSQGARLPADPMRPRRSKPFLLVLALLLAAEAAPAGAFVLCRAPGDHAAIESPVEAAHCRSDAAAGGFGETLSRATQSCVDVPLLEPTSPSRLGSDAGPSLLAALVVSCAAPPAPRVAPHYALEPAAVSAADRIPRLLRAVVLLV